MRLTLACPIYRRPDITRLCLEYYRETFPDITIIAIESPNDVQHHVESVNYFSFPNGNLAQKFNECFIRSREFEPDAVVLTGSCDILSPLVIDFYKNELSNRVDFIVGLKDFYLYERQSRKAIHWHGLPEYNSEQFPIGAGRLFTKNILDKIEWRPYGDLKMERGLDTNSSLYMQSKGVEHRCVSVKKLFCGIGIKDKNLTTINPFEAWLHNGEYVSNQILYDAFPAFFEKLHKPLYDEVKFDDNKMIKCVLLKPLKELRAGDYITVRGAVAWGLFNNGLIEVCE